MLALSTVSPTIRLWLNVASEYAVRAPDFAGFLYVAFASLGIGLVLGGIRWAVIDQINAATGIKRPVFNDAALQGKLNAYGLLIAAHYQYHKFYAHSLIAGITYAVVRRFVYGLTAHYDLIDGLLAVLMVIFWFAQRDALKNYYTRSARLLNEDMKGDGMTNGAHHDSTDVKKKAQPASKASQAQNKDTKNDKTAQSKKN